MYQLSIHFHRIWGQEMTSIHFHRIWGQKMTSIHFHRIWGQKMTKFTKWQKMQGLYPNHMHIFRPWLKKCAKFQKDWYKIVWGVVLTRYPTTPLYTEVENVTKNNLTIIAKPHAYPHTKKRSIQNCKRSCTHKVPRITVDGRTDENLHAYIAHANAGAPINNACTYLKNFIVE